MGFGAPVPAGPSKPRANHLTWKWLHLTWELHCYLIFLGSSGYTDSESNFWTPRFQSIFIQICWLGSTTNKVNPSFRLTGRNIKIIDYCVIFKWNCNFPTNHVLFHQAVCCSVPKLQEIFFFLCAATGFRFSKQRPSLQCGPRGLGCQEYWPSD